MIRYITAILVAAMVLLPVANSSPAGEADNGTPIINIQEPTYDWGEVPKGEVVTHAYTVLNQGTGPLKITRIQSD
jgi:hypothetical protein